MTFEVSPVVRQRGRTYPAARDLRQIGLEPLGDQGCSGHDTAGLLGTLGLVEPLCALSVRIAGGGLAATPAFDPSQVDFSAPLATGQLEDRALTLGPSS